LPAPIYAYWQIPKSFSGEKIVADKADEAAGLAPSNEDNDVSGNFSPEKPYYPLSIDGIESYLNLLFIHGRKPKQLM